MKSILKKSSFTFLSLASILFAGTLIAPAAIEVANPSTCYDTENWYVVRTGGTPTLSATDSSITLGTLNNSDTYIWAFMDTIHLDVSQRLTISFSLNFAGKTMDSTKFLFGVFNSASLSQSSLDAILADNSVSTHGVNSDGKTDTLSTKTLTKNFTGIFASYSNVYSRHTGTADHAFMSTASGTNSYQSTTAMTSSIFETLSTGTDYKFSMTLLRLEDVDDVVKYSVSVSCGEETQIVEVENPQTDFNLIGFRSPVSSSASLTFSNFSISTTGTIIPEPSLFGLFAGTLAIALAGTGRRRRK